MAGSTIFKSSEPVHTSTSWFYHLLLLWKRRGFGNVVDGTMGHMGLKSSVKSEMLFKYVWYQVSMVYISEPGIIWRESNVNCFDPGGKRWARVVGAIYVHMLIIFDHLINWCASETVKLPLNLLERSTQIIFILAKIHLNQSSIFSRWCFIKAAGFR